MEAFKISLDNIGRRFNREWIFKAVNYTFEHNESYAILGPNGSGKSTLLQVLSGSLTPSEGNLSYVLDGSSLPVEDVYKHLVIAAPYLELIEEFTLREIIDFHFKFKGYRDDLNSKSVNELLSLNASNKPLKYFSSGMKQRVKLALAFCSDTPVLLLDEPTANLDQQGIDWYLSLIDHFSKNRLVIICSNQLHEYQFCKHQLSVLDYKL
ncbi:MAG: transporter ATP-binding protein [Sphingobacteriales bacterium]|nr:transporter ATP-binding protein [Sphingobacteriales bacterium]